MDLAFYTDARDNKPACVDASWPELVDLLSEVKFTDCHPCAGKECPHKFCQAWSPVKIAPGGMRANDNVMAVTVAVFDLDHLDHDALVQVAERIEGFEHLLHSTHNPGCYRLVMPLSRDVTPGEWRTFLRTAVAEMKLPADPACKDLSRLYFLPTCPTGRDPLVAHGEGASLDVDAILALASKHGTTMHRIPMPDETPDETPDDITTDIATLRKRLAEWRRKKASSTKPDDAERWSIMGRVLKGEPLAQEGARDNTVNQASSLLAFVLASGTPSEAVIELLRPSIGAMHVEPEGVGHWIDRARFSYERAMGRRIERDAQRAEDERVIGDRMRAMAKPRALTAPDAAPTTPTGDAPHTEAEEPDAWRADLIMRADKTPKSCGENAVVILSKHPEVKGSLRFNEVTKELEVHGGRFAGVSSEVLDVCVADWLCREFGMSLGLAEVGQRLMRVARMNSYDPLADYLHGLVWDGVPRAKDFLTYYCDAPTVDSAGTDIAEHLKRIGQRWLISAVARGLNPGCQVDTTLILEGKQGVRKTSALRVLGGPFFVTMQLVLGDKDTKMLAARNWIVELAELASLRRGESASQKAFLTTTEDQCRPPYGRVLVRWPRRCVFVGTVNPDDGGYLTDTTGNRRYWPVLCGPGMYDRLEVLARDRDQIWAEAVALYKAGECWWLNASDQSTADAQADERLGESAIESRTAEWWAALHPSKRPHEVTTAYILESVLGFPFDRITRDLQMQVGTALRRLNFTKKRTRIDGRSTSTFTPTPEMLSAPQGTRAVSHLRLIANANSA